MNLQRLFLFGLLSLLALACIESPDDTNDCIDCGDTIQGESDVSDRSDVSLADVGVDRSDLGNEPSDQGPTGPDASPIDPNSAWCPADSDLELVLTPATLSGTLDLDGRNAGERFRPRWARDAHVEATEVQSGLRFTTPVADDGTYSLPLFTGEYTVVVRFNDPWCHSKCPFIPFATDLVIDGDTVLNHRVEIALFTAGISLDSDQVPASNEQVDRGWIYFIDPQTNRAIRYELNDVRPASIYIWIPQGQQYEVYWTPEQKAPQPAGQASNELPVGLYHLGTASTDVRPLNYDVPTIVVQLTARGIEGFDLGGTGSLHINPFRGLIEPEDGTERRWLPNRSFELEFDDVREPLSEFRIFPDRYTTVMQVTHEEDSHNFVACQASGNCEWRENGAISIDFTSTYPTHESVAVTGTLNFVDADGQRIVLDPSCDATSVVFLNAETKGYSALTLAQGDDQYFETALPVGVHDIWILGRSCFIGATQIMGVEISDEMALSLTVPLVPLNVELLMNGARLPDDSLLDADGDGRGVLEFISLDYPQGSQTARPLGESGPATFEALALPGQYQVRLSTMKMLGRTLLQPMAQNVLPSAIKDLGSLTIQGPTEYQANLTVHPVQGQLRIDPGALPTRFDNTRAFYLRLMSTTDESFSWLSLDDDYTFSGLLYEGSYQTNLRSDPRVQILEDPLAFIPASIDIICLDPEE